MQQVMSVSFIRKIKEELTMNTELQIFDNSEFGSIRTIEVNGKPYFCGSDVASAL